MLRISSRLDYGIIILQTLAKLTKRGPVSLGAIAGLNNLPYRYLTRIIQPLKKAGLVKAQEGKRGGYTLNKPPAKITLHEIVQILEPKKELTRCTSTSHSTCSLKYSCPMAPWWMKFNTKLELMLKKITLKDLL